MGRGQEMCLPPGRFGLPFIGDTLPFARDPEKFFREKHEKFGQVFKFRFMGHKTIAVSGWQLIGKVLQNEPGHDLIDLYLPGSMQECIVKGAIPGLSNAEHCRMRKALVPALSGNCLDEKFGMIYSVYLSTLQSQIGAGYFDAGKMMDQISLEVMTKYALGEQFKGLELKQFYRDYEIISEGIYGLPVNLPGFGFRKALQARQRLVEVMSPIIQAKRAEQRTQGSVSSLMEVLLQAEDDDAFVATASISLIWAGRHTTARSLTELVYHLLAEPRPTAKLHEEILGVLKKYPGILENPAELKRVMDTEMVYLNAYLHEVLRLKFFSPSLRKVKESFTCGGYDFPKGWLLILNGDTKEYGRVTDPGEFLPERFLPDSEVPNNKRAEWTDLLNFSEGVRSCFGRYLAMTQLRLALFLLGGGKYSLSLQPGKPFKPLKTSEVFKRYYVAVSEVATHAKGGQVNTPQTESLELPEVYKPLTILPRKAPYDQMPKILRSSVAAHSTREDCWIIIQEHVYDVTGFLDLHPGSSYLILDYAGKDASTVFFKDTVHSLGALEWLRALCIGVVTDDPTEAQSELVIPRWGQGRNTPYRECSIVELTMEERGQVTQDAKPSWFEARLVVAYKSESVVHPLASQHYVLRLNSAPPDFDTLLERAYTPVSWTDNHLHFVLKLYNDGSMSRVMKSLSKGDKIEVRGPFGYPVVDEFMDSGYTSLSMIVAGSGITPMISIVDQLSERLDSPDSAVVNLLYYVKNKDEGMCETDLEGLQKKAPNFKVTRCMTGETSVHALENTLFGPPTLEHLKLPGVVGKESGKTLFVICGPPAFCSRFASWLRKGAGAQEEDIIVMGS